MELCVAKSKTADHPENTVTMVKHGGGSIILWGCCSTTATGQLVRIASTLDEAKYKVIVEETFLVTLYTGFI